MVAAAHTLSLSGPNSEVVGRNFATGLGHILTMRGCMAGPDVTVVVLVLPFAAMTQAGVDTIVTT